MTSTCLFRYILIISFSWLLYHAYRIVRIIRKVRKLGRAVDQFPMDKRHWIKGHVHKLASEEALSYFEKLMHKYPKACGLYITCLIPYVLVHHPETVKVVLKRQGGKPQFFGIYRYARLWVGESLVMSSGNKWLRNRRLLTPTFHFDALKHYLIIKNETSDLFMNNLSKLAVSNSSFDIYSLSTLLTFDTILRCAFSYQSEVQTAQEKHFYLKAVDELLKLLIKRQYNPLHHFDFIYWRTSDGNKFSKNCQKANNFPSSLIRERKKLFLRDPESAEKNHDFLDLLVRSKDEDGNSLTENEMRNEINNFIGGGYKTTAGALSWTLYCLAANSEYQKRCQEEVDALMKGRSNDRLTWKDLEELPLLTMCLKESLRLYGPPFVERELDEETLIDGKMVPAGTTIMINLYGLHRNPEVWEDPLIFNPERFLPENIEKLDPFAFVPFSAGPRNCIGQAFAIAELKVVLARSLKRFNFTLKENHFPVITVGLILRSSNGIYLNVSAR